MTTTAEAPVPMDAHEPPTRKAAKIKKTKDVAVKAPKSASSAPKEAQSKHPKAQRVKQANAAPRALGGVPRADLLPPAAKAAYKGRSVVRMLIVAVVMVAVIVAGGVAFATVRAVTSQDALQRERTRSTELVARQLNFAEARQASNKVDAAKAARKLATVTEIDWRAYLDEITATLPPGVGLTQVKIEPVDTKTPAGEVTAKNPLQQAAVSTVTITATSTTVPDVEAWFNDLATTTGFAGIAPPATVTGSPTEGYVVSLQVLVNEKAYLSRFQDTKEK